MDNIDNTVRCKGPCARFLPRTKEHFGYQWGAKDKMHGTCRKCIAARAGVVKGAKNQSEQIAKRVHDDAVITLAQRLSGAPHTAEETELICDAFGGAQAFAQEFYNVYCTIRDNGVVHGQIKMLGMVLQMITKNTEMGGAKKPLELLSEEELDQYIMEQAARAAYTLKITDDRQAS